MLQVPSVKKCARPREETVQIAEVVDVYVIAKPLDADAVICTSGSPTVQPLKSGYVTVIV